MPIKVSRNTLSHELGCYSDGSILDYVQINLKFEVLVFFVVSINLKCKNYYFLPIFFDMLADLLAGWKLEEIFKITHEYIFMWECVVSVSTWAGDLVFWIRVLINCVWTLGERPCAQKGKCLQIISWHRVTLWIQ